MARLDPWARLGLGSTPATVLGQSTILMPLHLGIPLKAKPQGDCVALDLSLSLLRGHEAAQKFLALPRRFPVEVWRDLAPWQRSFLKNEKVWRRIRRHVLACPGRLWECGPGCCLPKCWHRSRGCIARFWIDCPDDGLCHRPRLRLSLESGCLSRSAGGRTFFG